MLICLKEFIEFDITKDPEIISAILKSDLKGIDEALAKNPACINAIHEDSGMNAVMLAVHGDMEQTTEKFLTHADLLDFEHTDNDGEDLMLIAMGATSDRNMHAVSDAYERHAAHLLNNFDAHTL